MDARNFRQIGKGFCGSVWAADRDGPALAMKREDGGPQRSVAQDSTMHVKIESSMKQVQISLGLATQVNIPHHHKLISADDNEWWNSRASRFPHGYQHCNTLITERILPLQRAAREHLVDMFCNEKAKKAVKQNRDDEDCLVRPYLGRRTHNAAPSRFFTLRNKPLCINQLENINAPVEDYARAMAETLAVMYWHAKVDANDIEFVIAPGRTTDDEAFDSDLIGRHALWVLDFDCAKELTFDDAGIQRAATAYLRNDPYWPRPCSEVKEDGKLWRMFKEKFLDASALILGDGDKLPQMLIDRIEQLGMERLESMMALRGRE